MEEYLDLIILFFVALLSATVLPAQSETMLAWIHNKSNYSTILLLITATSGNVLGSLINWLLGKYFIELQDKKWFPVNKKQILKADKIYKKYGIWTLLFAWVPFIGDPLTVIAGIFKVNISLFLILVTIGKASRYALLLYII